MTSKDWKEIDQARIRGTKTERKKSAFEQRAEKKASSEAKAQLEKLFQASPLSKEKKARIAKIKESRARPEFQGNCQDYMTEFGVPMDWETQSLFLDHKDPKLLLAVLSEILRTAPREEMSKQELIAQKLKVMELSVFDRDVLAKIKEVKSSLFGN